MTELVILPSAIEIREVGPSDGLRHEDPIDVAAKVGFVDLLSSAGLRRIDVAAFVDPARSPQAANADAVWARFTPRAGVRYSATVHDSLGAARALAAGCQEVRVLLAASERFNQVELGRSTDELLEDLVKTVDLVHTAGGTVGVVVGTAWGCPYQGEVAAAQVLSTAFAALTQGADELTYSDPVGMATPTRVADIVSRTREMFPDRDVGLHLCDTRGSGLVNAYAGMLLGVTRFDTSVGGVGTSPYVLAAPGTIATDELVALVEDMGIRTDINLEALLDSAAYAQLTLGKPLASTMLLAAPSSRPVAESVA